MCKNSMRRWQVALAALLLSGSAWANGAAEQFQQFVQTFPAATGRFEQVILDEAGEPAQTPQTGEFSFERPGKFRWAVQEPHQQLIVSDGKTVQQYDPDLRQLTVRPVDASMGTSPAALLFGETRLDALFQLSTRPDADGMTWVRATPDKPDSGLSRVDIGMREGQPARLLVLDGFGQLTRIDLSRIRVQPSFPADVFVFNAPAGTDVIEVQ